IRPETFVVTPVHRKQAEVCVIYNPVSGRGYSRRVIRAVQKRLRSGYDFRPMNGPGAGEEMAAKAILEGFRTIVAAGGDGTIHEVANGVLTSGRSDIVCGVWPMGSANDYAFALNLAQTWNTPPDRLTVTNVDVGVAQADGRRPRFFVNGLGLGFNAAVTV